MINRYKDIKDVHSYLNSIPNFGMHGKQAAHFSLDAIKQFCLRIGNPQEKLKAIHIAGTNGKGTVCQMLSSVYQEAGFKTGLYTSPHLIEFNERIKVNDRMIPDSAILDFFQEFEPLLNEIKLTYFEISTCLAFWYLEREGVDISIIETGLGGRLDATNILLPLASVITSVSLDHTDILGDSISDIAREKGGIIKDSTPVVIGNIPNTAERVIRNIALEHEAKVIHALQYLPSVHGEYFELIIDERSIKIKKGTRKKVDALNVASCWSVVQELNHFYPVNENEFISGVERVDAHYPVHAHFEKLHDSLDWYFDGAHNSEAIDSLLDQIEDMFEGGQATLFLSMMKDKATPEVLRKFCSFSSVYYVDMGTDRSAGCSQISDVLTLRYCFNKADDAILTTLLELKRELVIFTGSFYFYSQVKKWMASLIPSEDSYKLRA